MYGITGKLCGSMGHININPKFFSFVLLVFGLGFFGFPFEFSFGGSLQGQRTEGRQQKADDRGQTKRADEMGSGCMMQDPQRINKKLSK